MNDINKRLCELLRKPHEIVDPEFVSPAGRIDLLKRMRKREDWTICYQTLGLYDASGLLFYILDDTGAFAQAVLEFLEGKA